MGGRIRTFPTTGEEAVAEAITGVGRTVDRLRRQQMRMPQRGHSEDDTVYTVLWSDAVTARAATEIEVTIPVEASQLRVYAEAKIDETVAGGGLPALKLFEDSVDLGHLLVIDDSWAEDGRVVCTGSGGAFTRPGGSIFRTGSTGFAVPPWGSARHYQPTPGTHTYALGTAIEAGSAVSGSYDYWDLKMWIEVL